MFCKKCGSAMKDGGRFCPRCGTENTIVPIAKENGIDVLVIHRKKKWIPIAAVFIVLVLAIVIVTGTIKRNSATKNSASSSMENAAIAFVKAIYMGDGEAIVSLLPEEYVEYLCDESGLKESQLIEKMEDTLDNWYEGYCEWYEDEKAIKAMNIEIVDAYECDLDALGLENKEFKKHDIPTAESIFVTDEFLVDQEWADKYNDGDTSLFVDGDPLTIEIDGKWYAGIGWAEYLAGVFYDDWWV